ncbi:MAG: acyl-CoA thioesterase [Neisseriaceae bacterium]|nr:acyl-CoA thioesterase [Neisseriaceae bacterium]
MLPDTIIKVHGYHLDVYQHVNNARYLEFLEEARWNALEDGILIKTLQEKNWGFAVVNINIAFRRAAVLGDVLVIKTEHAGFTNRSAILKQTIINQANNKIISEADVTYTIFDMATNKAVVLDEPLRNLILNATQ